MHVVTGNPTPCRFGAVNWDPRTNEVTPVENPTALLNPLPLIEQESPPHWSVPAYEMPWQGARCAVE